STASCASTASGKGPARSSASSSPAACSSAASTGLSADNCSFEGATSCGFSILLTPPPTPSRKGAGESHLSKLLLRWMKKWILKRLPYVEEALDAVDHHRFSGKSVIRVTSMRDMILRPCCS